MLTRRTLDLSYSVKSNAESAGPGSMGWISATFARPVALLRMPSAILRENVAPWRRSGAESCAGGFARPRSPGALPPADLDLTNCDLRRLRTRFATTLFGFAVRGNY